MSSGREISFFLQHGFDDARGERGLVIRLSVGDDIAWDMLPNPLSRRSIISPRAFEDLQKRGLAASQNVQRFVVRDLRIAGQTVPDLDVRVSAATIRLRVDGILGLEFFGQFELVQWYPHTRRVTLVAP